jgi:hypothetical protein
MRIANNPIALTETKETTIVPMAFNKMSFVIVSDTIGENDSVAAKKK